MVEGTIAVRQTNTLSGRGPGGPQAHPDAPRAAYLLGSDRPPSRFSRAPRFAARFGAAAGWLLFVGVLGFLVVFAMLGPGS